VKQPKKSRNAKILELAAKGMKAAKIAVKFPGMTPEAVRAVLLRALPKARAQQPHGPNPGEVCRLLTDPIVGVAVSQTDLAEKVRVWVEGQGDASMAPLSLWTIKAWSSPKHNGRPAPTRRFANRVAPFDVLLRFAKAHGVKLPE
jgi:hypothetical protein